MSETRYFRVGGTVQGVGFRAATCDEARRQALSGWVRNRADGDVELVASGDATALDALSTWLRAGGPDSASVTRVDVSVPDTADTTELPEPFAVR